jgi:hypothetical protein
MHDTIVTEIEESERSESIGCCDEYESLTTKVVDESLHGKHCCCIERETTAMNIEYYRTYVTPVATSIISEYIQIETVFADVVLR